MSKINYYNIFINYQFEDLQIAVSSHCEHRLLFVNAGQMVVKSESENTLVSEGECFFLRRGTQVTIGEKLDSKSYLSLSCLVFSPLMLKKLNHAVNLKYLPIQNDNPIPSVMKFSSRPDVISLFSSFNPYFHTDIQPSEEVIKLKMLEGIYFLLSIDKQFFNYIFDYNMTLKNYLHLN